MKQLPKWCITDKFPAFYDTDSATSIEQTAKVYGAMRSLIDEYNKFADTVNKQIADYMESDQVDDEAFKVGIRQEFQDFIDTVSLHIQGQDKDIDKMNDYMVTNLRKNVGLIIEDMRNSGQLNEDIMNVFDDIVQTMTNQDATLQANITAEATERANQYNNLQDNINAEAGNRQAQFSLLEERINSLASLEEGSTTADAELIDARIDSNGNIHQSLGDSIRYQNNSILKKTVRQITNASLFREGSHAESNGTHYSTANSIRLKSKINKSSGIVGFETIEKTMKMYLFAWDSEGNYVGVYDTNNTFVKSTTNNKAFSSIDMNEFYDMYDDYTFSIRINNYEQQESAMNNVAILYKRYSTNEEYNDLLNRIVELEESNTLVIDSSLFREGGYAVGNGTHYSTANSIRMIGKFDEASGISNIRALNENMSMYLFAWDSEGNYVGVYDKNNNFVKTTANNKSFSSIDMGEFYSLYGGYSFSISASGYDNQTEALQQIGIIYTHNLNERIKILDEKVALLEESIDSDFEFSNVHERLSVIEDSNGFAWKEFDKGYVVLCLDDGYPSWSTICEQAESHNIPLSLALVSSRLSIPVTATESFPTGSTVKTVSERCLSNGGEILCHGNAFSDYNDSIEIANGIKAEKIGLLNNHFPTKGYVAPNNIPLTRHKEIVRRYFRYGVNAISNMQPYQITRTSMMKTNDDGSLIDIAYYQNLIDEAIDNKSLLVLYAHGFPSDVENGIINRIEEILSYLTIKQDSGDVECTTLSYLYDTFKTTKLEKRISTLENA